MAAIPPFPESQLTMICDILGDAESGLSESEMVAFLAASNIKESSRGDSRRKRLFESFWAQQLEDGCANNVVAFIHKAMYHVLHTGQSQLFEQRRGELNAVMAFSGLMLGEDGRLSELISQGSTVSPAAKERNKNIRDRLQSLAVHPDVLAACMVEHLIENNYFYLEYEAVRRLTDKIRLKSRLKLSSKELIQRAFEIGDRGYPLLALNRLQTEGEKAEQGSFLELLKGLISMFGQDSGGKPKVSWMVDEQEAVEFLCFISLLQRRLDKSVITSPVN